ncbi:hypothetical protein D3C78_852890 [compost metagenome]
METCVVVASIFDLGLLVQVLLDDLALHRIVGRCSRSINLAFLGVDVDASLVGFGSFHQLRNLRFFGNPALAMRSALELVDCARLADPAAVSTLDFEQRYSSHDSGSLLLGEGVAILG